MTSEELMSEFEKAMSSRNKTAYSMRITPVDVEQDDGRRMVMKDIVDRWKLELQACVRQDESQDDGVLSECIGYMAGSHEDATREKSVHGKTAADSASTSAPKRETNDDRADDGFTTAAQESKDETKDTEGHPSTRTATEGRHRPTYASLESITRRHLRSIIEALPARIQQHSNLDAQAGSVTGLFLDTMRLRIQSMSLPELKAEQTALRDDDTILGRPGLEEELRSDAAKLLDDTIQRRDIEQETRREEEGAAEEAALEPAASQFLAGVTMLGILAGLLMYFWRDLPEVPGRADKGNAWLSNARSEKDGGSVVYKKPESEGDRFWKGVGMTIGWIVVLAFFCRLLELMGLIDMGRPPPRGRRGPEGRP